MRGPISHNPVMYDGSLARSSHISHSDRLDQYVLYSILSMSANAALAGQQRVLGADHEDTLATAANLVSLLETGGRFEEALELRTKYPGLPAPE